GISNEFSSIEECSVYYKQAVMSLEIGKVIEPKDCIYKYADAQPYIFVYMVKDQISKESFLNNSLHMLKEYDNENDSNLYETLYIYLKNNLNMTKTSDEMFIHRNTLRYRLKKIHDIIGIDLEEDDNSFKLYYAYKSLDF